MLINVRLITENLLQLEVEPHTTMKQLKYLIGASQGCPPEDIVFVFMGRAPDNATIESLGINQYSLVRFGIYCHDLKEADWK
ncbi:unnamed protein product [Blepharisma stoltei]|uniref:Ubiquitin-like domain-containing protein n=1 Tax=Blepharisma stoltei TaxID=1481888 RepID=A0AAU9IP68_9CILI|nr:unnamed protein product [Blepharisma stoltei]